MKEAYLCKLLIVFMIDAKVPHSFLVMYLFIENLGHVANGWKV